MAGMSVGGFGGYQASILRSRARTSRGAWASGLNTLCIALYVIGYKSLLSLLVLLHGFPVEVLLHSLWVERTVTSMSAAAIPTMATLRTLVPVC